MLKCLSYFLTWNSATCILCIVFAVIIRDLLSKKIVGISSIEEFHLDVCLLEFTRHCGTMVFFPSVSVSSEKQVVGTINTREGILAIIERCPPRLSTRRTASRIAGISRMLVLRTLHEEDLSIS